MDTGRMASSLAFRGASLVTFNHIPSSSSSAHQWTYDVFLSFRGKDTCKNFSAHLYDVLDRNGLKTFRDDEQPKRGEEIPSSLLKVIEESRISVVVLSENYASSSWCLDQLTKIFECREEKKHMVLPVFYGVLQSDVRNHRNNIKKSFGKLEERFRDNPEKVKRWKAVLRQVGNINGWQLHGDVRPESEVIHKIVQFIAKKTSLQVAKNPVGIESPARESDLSSSPSPIRRESLRIESPVQVPHLSNSPSRNGYFLPVGIESAARESDLSSSPSPIRTESLRVESPVQVPHLSNSPSRNGERGSNSFLSSHGIIFFLIGSVIGLLQLDDLFQTHPANMWISVAALIIFCLSYAAMANINGTRWETYSQDINTFRILSGTLVVVSLLSIPLPHQLSWLFYVPWAIMVSIVVACTWIYPEAEGS